MEADNPVAVRLKDYAPSKFLILNTFLEFKLEDDISYVTSKIVMSKNPKLPESDSSLSLKGNQNLNLLWIDINGLRLEKNEYQLTKDNLLISNVPDSFEISIKVAIKPQENTTMMGLYRSRKMFCTQCEAEGFRSITFFLDRPDVMSEFTTKIIANEKKFPVLLSNGNLLREGKCDDGNHFAVWNDPHKKPSYLFALVAGSLSVLEDSFETMSGRKVVLKIFVEEKDLNKCDYACLLYTSPSPRDRQKSRMPSSA